MPFFGTGVRTLFCFSSSSSNHPSFPPISLLKQTTKQPNEPQINTLMRSIMSPSLSLSSFAAPACLSLGAWGAPFLSSSSSSSSSHLCPFSSLYVSITHGYQHVEPVSVAQAWDWACSGWTVWACAGSCVDLTSDFSANDCIITSVYVGMCFSKFITTLALRKWVTHLTLHGPTVFVLFFQLSFWTLTTCFVSSTLANLIFLFCHARFSLNSKAVRVDLWMYLLSTHWSLYHCVCVCLSCARCQITIFRGGGGYNKSILRRLLLHPAPAASRRAAEENPLLWFLQDADKNSLHMNSYWNPAFDQNRILFNKSR